MKIREIKSDQIGKIITIVLEEGFNFMQDGDWEYLDEN